MPRRGLVLVALMLAGPVAGQERQGVLVGRVVDVDTRVPLVGVAVQVGGTELGTLTDGEGRFRLPAVPVGSYAVSFRMFGYEPLVRTDVIIRSARITSVDVELTVAAFEMDALVVRPSYFPLPDREPTSAVAFSAEELRRAPGSAGDVSRIVMTLPSLAKVNDQSNSLIVRGGSPLENAFLVDGIEIPNINHFPTQGASGGPIGLLNVDLVRGVEFLTGGFSAVHGDRLSSVMELELREGNRSELDAQLDLGFAGFGGVVEGPLAGGSGSWLVSVRRSYVDLLVKAFDVGATVAPRYGDYQAKLTLDVAPGHALALVGVWADDRMRSDLEQAIENAMLAFGSQDILQGTTGLTWTVLWNARAHTSTTLAYSGSWFDETFTETNADELLIRNRSAETALRLTNRTRLQLAEGLSLHVGATTDRVEGAFDNLYAGHVGPLGDTVPEQVVDRTVRGVKAGAFLSANLDLGRHLATTVGVRADHFSLTHNTTVSPRASVKVRLAPRTDLNAAVGLYRQALPVLFLAQDPRHRSLRDPRAVHYVLGLSHLLEDDTRLTLEAYHKDYDRMPVDPDQPALFPLDELFYDFGFFTAHPNLTDTGAARAAGVEAMIQKKLVRDLYGLVSAAYFRTRYRGADGIWRDRVFDNRVSFAVEGGYKPGDRWELSARWIYAGGPPYTPLDPAASAAFDRAVLDRSRINDARYPDYHALNLRVDRRFNWERTNMIVYLSVWNAYDRKNVAAYYWNGEEDRRDVIHQWGVLPVFGVELEF